MKTTIELTTESDMVSVTFDADGKVATVEMTKAELVEYIKGK